MDEDSAARTYIEENLSAHGYLSWLNLELVSASEGHVTMRVPYDEKLTNHGPGSRGELHGGIAATLVDTAGGVACRSTFDDPLSGGVATIDLDVSYLDAAAGDLVASADVIRAGGTIGVAEIGVESVTPDGEDALVAHAKGTYRLFRPDG